MKKTIKKIVKKVLKPKEPKIVQEKVNLNEEIYLALSKRQRRRQRKDLGM